MGKAGCVLVAVATVLLSGSVVQAQNQNPIQGLFGGILQGAARQAAADKWKAVPADVTQCMSENFSPPPQELVQRGIAPDSREIAPYIQRCTQMLEQRRAEAQRLEEQKRQEAQAQARREAAAGPPRLQMKDLQVRSFATSENDDLLLATPPRNAPGRRDAAQEVMIFSDRVNLCLALAQARLNNTYRDWMADQQITLQVMTELLKDAGASDVAITRANAPNDCLAGGANAILMSKQDLLAHRNDPSWAPRSDPPWTAIGGIVERQFTNVVNTRRVAKAQLAAAQQQARQRVRTDQRFSDRDVVSCLETESGIRPEMVRNDTFDPMPVAAALDTCDAKVRRSREQLATLLRVDDGDPGDLVLMTFREAADFQSDDDSRFCVIAGSMDTGEVRAALNRAAGRSRAVAACPVGVWGAAGAMADAPGLIGYRNVIVSVAKGLGASTPAAQKILSENRKPTVAILITAARDRELAKIESERRQAQIRDEGGKFLDSVFKTGALGVLGKGCAQFAIEVYQTDKGPTERLTDLSDWYSSAELCANKISFLLDKNDPEFETKKLMTGGDSALVTVVRREENCLIVRDETNSEQFGVRSETGAYCAVNGKIEATLASYAESSKSIAQRFRSTGVPCIVGMYGGCLLFDKAPQGVARTLIRLRKKQ